MNEHREKCFRGGRRQAILDVANKIFSKEGYAAASMSHIAAQLGGSKGTLYNYFRSKEELFEAHIEERCEHFQMAIFTPPLEGDTPSQLLNNLAERILTTLVSDDSIAFYRLVVAEAERNTAVGKALYKSGPSAGIRLIAELLDRMRHEGQLLTDDCVRAAEEFFSLVHGGLHLRRILNVIPRPSPDEIKIAAAQLTETFLRAYGPKA
jgi:AcrR family transcriptional regulator